MEGNTSGCEISNIRKADDSTMSLSVLINSKANKPHSFLSKASRISDLNDVSLDLTLA